MPLATTSTSSSSLRGSQRSSCSTLNGPKRSCTTAAVIFMSGPGLLGSVGRLGEARNRFCKILRGLRARDRELSSKDEAGNALNACFLGGQCFALDLSDVFVAGERRAHLLRIEADIRGGFDQYVAVGEVGALGEIEIHQPLFHGRRLADGVRPADQAVGIECIRLPADLVDGVGQPFERRSCADALRDAVVTFGGAELRGEVLFACDPFAWNPVVEEIGAIV